MPGARTPVPGGHLTVRGGALWSGTTIVACHHPPVHAYCRRNPPLGNSFRGKNLNGLLIGDVQDAPHTPTSRFIPARAEALRAPATVHFDTSKTDHRWRTFGDRGPRVPEGFGDHRSHDRCQPHPLPAFIQLRIPSSRSRLIPQQYQPFKLPEPLGRKDLFRVQTGCICQKPKQVVGKKIERHDHTADFTPFVKGHRHESATRILINVFSNVACNVHLQM